MSASPTTSIDHRFSDPDATAVSWSETAARLERAQLSWITTVRADGSPHVTPLVSVWHDGAAYFCTGPDEQKAVNLRANPRVVLTTGCADWQDGVDVMVEGAASVVTDRTVLEALARRWAEKWDGDSWIFEARSDGFHHGDGGGVAEVYEVVPSKVLAFGKGTFSHTRHRFG